MISQNVISLLERNKARRESGKTIAIPWSLPRLSGVLPGIVQGRYTIVTANAKVGKTQLTDFLFLYQPLEWLMNNMDDGISLKIFYFSLEMSKENKMLAAISYKLHKDYDIIISPEKLQSYFQGYVLEDRVLSIIKSDKFQVWLRFIEEHVEFNDAIRHPFGIFNYVKTYAEANGHYEKKEILWTNEDGSREKRVINDKYIPNNPDEYVIVITDHASLLRYKDGGTLHEAMGSFSNEFCMHMRDKWNYIPVVVQQQSAASEQQQFTNKGTTIVEKLKPSPDYLGDNKLTGRDCDLMLGLFWPYRYNIEKYNDWDLTQVGKYHRELSILLNRNGTSNASIDLYMNGASNYFKELPREEDERVYEYVRRQEITEKQLFNNNK